MFLRRFALRPSPSSGAKAVVDAAVEQVRCSSMPFVGLTSMAHVAASRLSPTGAGYSTCAVFEAKVLPVVLVCAGGPQRAYSGPTPRTAGAFFWMATVTYFRKAVCTVVAWSKRGPTTEKTSGRL